MTLLVASIFVDRVTELDALAGQAWAGGADAIELRIDTLGDDPEKLAAYLKEHTDRTWIVTCRPAEEGGNFRGDIMERIELLLAIAHETDAYVDFEFADWRRSSDIRQKILLASAVPRWGVHRLILSAHDFDRLPSDLAATVGEMVATPESSVAKAAYHCDSIVDSFASLDLTRRYGGLVTVTGMGEDGLWSRVLAKKLGAFASYCALDSNSAAAPGQLTLAEMADRYRWKRIDDSTRVFGVIGDPVAHSMSPLLFNRWFAETGVNAVYLPLRVHGNGEGLRCFLDACMHRPWLDLGGLSVTLPHKRTAYEWVGDGADSRARGFGAVNTLVFRTAGVKGYNTDCYAAISSLADALGRPSGDLAGMTMDVLGSGGVARAVVMGLREHGCEVTVYGRTPEKTRGVADEYSCQAASWEGRLSRSGEVLINCTGVGMWPAIEDTPMPPDSLKGCSFVFDLIYNPLETRLLKNAADAGIRTLGGLDMFIRQAAMQFELWTGKTPNQRPAREMVAHEIRRRTGADT